MKCEYCNNEIQPGLAKCQACGAPAPAVAAAPAPVAAPAPQPTYTAPQHPYPAQQPVYTAPQPTYALPYAPKSRISYILLALFLGTLGVHNFYAKRTGCAITQLLITVLSFGFLAAISGLWAFIEMIVVTEDGNRVPFQ